MASPNELEIQDQIGKKVQILDEIDKFARSNTPNFTGMFDALVVLLETDYQGDASEALDDLRSTLSELIDSGVPLVTAGLRTYAKFMDVPEQDAASIMFRLYEHMNANSLTVNSRGFTFGTPTETAAPLGDGEIYRCNVDRKGEQIENQTPEAKVARCVADEHSNASEHEERFEFRGAATPRDLVAGFKGAQRSAIIRAVSARDSRERVQNPSFDQLDGTVSSLTSIPGWTETNSLTNFQLDQTTYYRDFVGTTPAALRFDAADKVTQNFNVQNASFDLAVPYYCQIAVNASAGTAVGGNVILTLGGVSKSVTIASLSAGWNIVAIDIGANSWFENFNEEDLDISIEWTVGTSGYLLVDDLVLAPFAQFDGGWYLPVGGATPFLFDKTFEWTDTAGAAILQEWFHRLFNAYLPSNNAGTETWADPT